MIKILWIPGLGANEVMFIPMLKEFHRYYQFQIQNVFFKYYDVPPNQIQNLEEYADFLYEKNQTKLSFLYDIVIGCSLGGMILQTLIHKKKIQSRIYVLLSTGFHGDQLTFLSKFLTWLVDLIPTRSRRTLQLLISYSYRYFRFDLKFAYQFSKMFEDFPTNVFFESPKWIRNWEGIPEDELFSPNFYVIHGTRDPLLSFKKIQKTRKPNLVIKKGNHILFALYPKILTEKIRDFYLSYTRIAQTNSHQKKKRFRYKI
ncbi:MAG: alpha/beta hydrolase [Leptospiraceae bacterium]|nr:alpha/beta hydrolase [Leptospiraceae bacterium]MDW7976505.1 alpha/beta hydrolase [Leptospiraceae bacterium]